MDSPYVLVTNGQLHDCDTGFFSDVYVCEGMLVCEFCRVQVKPEGRITGPSPDELGAGELCTEPACFRTCEWSGWDFVREAHVNGMDAQVICMCEHHDAYRLALSGKGEEATRVDRQRLAFAVQPFPAGAM